jgi:hypothetical protein
MKLNYIDIDETPVSVTFNRSCSMERIAKTFEEINTKLEEHNDARL